jgi:membrane protein insertase Oxa1/YidC/SpoIIIJ
LNAERLFLLSFLVQLPLLLRMWRRNISTPETTRQTFVFWGAEEETQNFGFF